MEDIEKKIADHFERYSATDVVYESGGVLYLSRSAAESYGKGEVRDIHRNNPAARDPKAELSGTAAKTPQQNERPGSKTAGHGGEGTGVKKRNKTKKEE